MVVKILSLGQPVKVMYPYDARWWETKGFIVGYDEENVYRVRDLYFNEVSIDIGYLEW